VKVFEDCRTDAGTVLRIEVFTAVEIELSNRFDRETGKSIVGEQNASRIDGLTTLVGNSSANDDSRRRQLQRNEDML
jgi:hypothetical protein